MTEELSPLIYRSNFMFVCLKQKMKGSGVGGVKPSMALPAHPWSQGSEGRRAGHLWLGRVGSVGATSRPSCQPGLLPQGPSHYWEVS